MRSYRDMLKKNKINVDYYELKQENSDTYEDYLYKYLKNLKIKTISLWTIEDKWFETKLRRLEKKE